FFCSCLFLFFFTFTSPPVIYTLSLHDALPISPLQSHACLCAAGSYFFSLGLPHISFRPGWLRSGRPLLLPRRGYCFCRGESSIRSEEHTSELQSLAYLVCRLLLEKKKKKTNTV